ncbi:MAG: Na+/H+ antiporter subunit E [Salaquimonas sp.]
MSLLLVNLLLMLAWGAMTGSFTELNLIFGFVLGFFAIWLIREQIGTGGYFGKTTRMLSLFLLFIKELSLSAFRVAMLVLRPDMNLKPGIFAFELTVDRDFEIALLANLITLTPGTLSVDVSKDRRYLFVHAIDCSDVPAAKLDIANGFERKILEAFR